MASGARLRVLVVCVFGLLLATALPQKAEARADVDFNVFVGALSPHGTWFDYPRYGRVWRPAHVRHDWRPYTDGRWVWSDDYGWVWDEDEDWGWATYHYGRWLFEPRHGWFWIPGYEWAPAWVSWRYGPSYVGWVPMGPSGFSIASYPMSRWSFVSHRHFFQPRLYRYAFAPNRRVFRECRDEIWMDQRRGRWFNRGGDRHHFERASRASTPVVRVRDWDRPERPHEARDRDGTRELRMYRPKVREARADELQKPRAPSADWIERRRAADSDRRAPIEARRDRRTTEVVKSTRALPEDDRSLRARAPERMRIQRDSRPTWQAPAARAPSRAEVQQDRRREMAAPLARPAPHAREQRVAPPSQRRLERAAQVEQPQQQKARPQAPPAREPQQRSLPHRGGRDVSASAREARAQQGGGVRGFERR